MLQVQLNLRRAHTVDNEFDVWGSVPDHCADAAISMFLADALRLQRKLSEPHNCTEENRRLHFSAHVRTTEKLAKLVKSPRKIMQTKLNGPLPFSLRIAAFTILMKYMNGADAPANSLEILEWAEKNGLRGHVREDGWLLSDVMFALQTLAVHWESYCEDVWSNHPQSMACSFFQRTMGARLSLQTYMDYLWWQCAKFMFMRNSADIAHTMDAGVFTLPYESVEGTEHEIALHPDAVSQMCELWRFLQYETEFPLNTNKVATWQSNENQNQEQFLSLFEFEKNQLDVDKFREDLRKRLAERHLLPADAAVYTSLTGKEADADSVMDKKSCLNVAGYLQQVASAWTFDEMVAVPHIRDELFRAMADSGCRSKVGSDFSSKFYRLPGPPLVEEPPLLQVPIIKRYMHAFIIVHKGEGITPPISFASAFAGWARIVHEMRMKPYGINFERITSAFH